ncbi:MAG: C2H2-type zinc finger protein [Bacteroidales bacterium]|nr:C2H2-type zinc finger protein [Bacteroidales bacterium]
MFTCDECGKKFKTMQALGGHRRAHPQKKPDAMPASDNPSPAAVEPPQTLPVPPASPDDEPGVMDTIREHRRRNLSAKQIKDLGYSRQTVDQVFLEDMVPEGKPNEEEHNDEFPVVTRGTEMVTPEGILRKLANGSPDWYLRLEGMMLLRAAQRMNRDDIEMSKMQAEAYAAMIKPTLELMKESRLEQDSAAARAKESNVEIAEKAAFEVAQDMKGVFSSEMQTLKASLPGGPEPPNPMMKALVDAMQPYLAQTMGQALSGLFKSGQQPGLSPQQLPAGTGMPGQPVQSATPDAAPSCMKPGEEDEFTEA